MFADIKKLFSYRELLMSLTRKELKVKYRGSVLGFFWSLLNPILTMLVYSFVFSMVLRAGIEQFAIFLICALLPFNFLSNSVNYGSGSIISNGNLVNKIYFPREILPLSVVFSNLVNFLFELAALFIVLSFMGYRFYLYLYLLPVLIFIQFFLVVGMTLLVSALNVFFHDGMVLRDTHHISIEHGAGALPGIYKIHKSHDYIFRILQEYILLCKIPRKCRLSHYFGDTYRTGHKPGHILCGVLCV